MSESKSIIRKKASLDAYSAEGLKSEGLKVVQDLSGETWTDYNLHDPGVTILEQVCYALTDLIYRTDFDTADYLTDKSGKIDSEKQALFHAESIFPSQAITLEDYRKILFDALPEIDYVWMRLLENENAALSGDYRIYVKLNEKLEAKESKRVQREILKKVKNIYSANRNLCENLASVHIVRPKYYSLHGAIDLSSDRDFSVILAEIYFRCARRLSPNISFHDYEKKLAEKSMEEVFEGPLTKHVYIEGEDLNQSRDSITISEMIGVINNIEGVRFIESLWFEDEAGEKMDTIWDDPELLTVPCLHLPEERYELGIHLLKNGRAYRVSLSAAHLEYERRYAQLQNLRQNEQHFAGLIQRPQGVYRDFSEYHSIQNDFPVIYGINDFGVPKSEADSRKAQAKQLKAYLLFFEQPMANYLASVAQIPRLFSADETLEQSYFSQVLNEDCVPNITGLYRDSGDDLEKSIAQTLSKYDPFFNRRSRVLDYLLGLYGEKFKQHSLRQHNCYYDEQGLELELIRNQLRLLQEIVEISQRRAAAFNCQQPSWNTNNTAGLKKKVSVLLGIHYSQNRSLVDVFVEKGLELLTDDVFKSLKSGTLALEYVDLSSITERIEHEFLEIPLRQAKAEGQGYDERQLFQEILFLKNNSLGVSILRNGIHMEHYRVGARGGSDGFQLVFKPGDDARWEYLAAFEHIEDAVSAANALRRLMIKLNVESEGLHLLEHHLFRPTARGAYVDVPEGFYPFRMSVIFPAWTARFYEKGFRLLAEETLRLNAPAHIYIDCYWLEFNEMNAFEVLYKKWLDKKLLEDTVDFEGNAADLDAAGKALTDFLLSLQAEQKKALVA
ncbi:MAG: hypothetical protein GXO96_08660 [Nitrospirae bacterium]|nr:hypothetical protein [Candidatus Manganitrophaceae bacterium]